MNCIMQSCFVVVTATVLATGCAHMPGKCDLGKVAKDTQMRNVTTGDGTFENYKTTGYYTSTEVGFAFGIPGIKIAELFPVQNDTEQMIRIAQDAGKAGANAVINVKPPQSMYTGIPFFFIGLYVDKAAGTGIKTK